MKLKLIVLLSLVGPILWAQTNIPTPDEVRVIIAQSISDLNIAPEHVSIVKNDFIFNGKDSIGIRIYQPALDGNFPIVYYVHGAAWVAGDIDTHDNICRYLANSLQAVVISVDYRRPPEHKFPVPFDDSYFIFKWINEHMTELKGNGKLILIGDSAGGQLVASICVVNSLSENPVPILAEVLVNPALNLSKGSVSYKTYPFFIDWYLNDTDKSDDARISPLLAKNVSKVPPAIIVVCENDEIRNDGEEYHKKLTEEGIVSSLFVQPKTGHLGIHWCAADEIAKPAMDFVTNKLKEFLP